MSDEDNIGLGPAMRGLPRKPGDALTATESALQRADAAEARVRDLAEEVKVHRELLLDAQQTITEMRDAEGGYPGRDPYLSISARYFARFREWCEQSLAEGAALAADEEESHGRD